MSRVAQRVEEWKRKIVDLSRRNRLLFFSRTRASSLRVVEPGLREIFDRLINQENSWKFLMPSDDEGAKESENNSGIAEARPDANLALEYPEAHGDRRLRSRPSPRHA